MTSTASAMAAMSGLSCRRRWTVPTSGVQPKRGTIATQVRMSPPLSSLMASSTSRSTSRTLPRASRTSRSALNDYATMALFDLKKLVRVALPWGLCNRWVSRLSLSCAPGAIYYLRKLWYKVPWLMHVRYKTCWGKYVEGAQNFVSSGYLRQLTGLSWCLSPWATRRIATGQKEGQQEGL